MPISHESYSNRRFNKVVLEVALALLIDHCPSSFPLPVVLKFVSRFNFVTREPNLFFNERISAVGRGGGRGKKNKDQKKKLGKNEGKAREEGRRRRRREVDVSESVEQHRIV